MYMESKAKLPGDKFADLIREGDTPIGAHHLFRKVEGIAFGEE